MSKDEETAFQLFEYSRRIHKSVIEEFNGMWLKEMGDGVLSSFCVASDAVLCAKIIQETFVYKSVSTFSGKWLGWTRNYYPGL